MDIVEQIKLFTAKALKELYLHDSVADELTITPTKPDFTGDYTIVLFSFIKVLRKSPEQLGNELGKQLVDQHPDFLVSYNVIKGFLNLSLSDRLLTGFLEENFRDPKFGHKPSNGQRVMVEYSSPNTNKPLHLGHLRNNFLGWSVAEILKAAGNEVIKTCIANDRGIHINKSIIAWQLFADGATPQSTGIKGDHLVGDYYVLFGNENKKEAEELVRQGMKQEDAEKETRLMKAAQQMLVDWEAGKPEVRQIWKTMNSWVFDGFANTYQRIGTDFDKVYYESETYLLGKRLVDFGLKQGVFYKKEDGSVWIDLTAEGLDEKIVQRRDGTAVYITQDIGLAVEKYEEFHCEKSIYVVGDEQNYHFKVLKFICQKLQLPSADGICHLSYGMVELPSGRMKTREGTVVDADEIVDEMIQVAAQKTEELGKVKDFEQQELDELFSTIGLGALKFFLLRVDPKRKMLFNPEESIDFHGFTGPFIQFTYARLRSILRKEKSQAGTGEEERLLPAERQIMLSLEQFPGIIQSAAREYNPSLLAIYVYDLAKSFSSLLTGLSVLNAESAHKKNLRLQLCEITANTIQTAMQLLGIRVPERM